MQCYKWKSALFLALFVFLDSSIVVRAQLPSFLSALYGGGLSGTSTPSPRPKGPPPGLQPRVPRPRQRIDRNDEAFGAPLSGTFSGVPGVAAVPVPQSIPVINPQIITATPNSPLQNNYIQQNNNNGPQLSSAPGGVINTPSQFSSSQNDFLDSSWPLSQPDLPKITNIQVQCEKTSIRVSIDFDRPFFGMVFSKGHFSDPNCVHLQAGSGATSTVFEIQNNQCGMTSSGGFQSDNGQPNPAGSFIESTIIVQYDPLVQEVFDQARKLRCTWYDYYEKSVTFRPFQVNMLNSVTANFLGDNLQCWMQIQSGKGPWASEVSGIVKIGQTMTMVLGIKDEENKFDMVVRNCVAHDGKRTPIQLVNELGCIIRPKIMSKFQKIKNFGASATVVSYAYFQAFKFPDSMNVHFQCVIQVCRYNCPDPVCPDDATSSTNREGLLASQATVTVAPVFSSNGQVSDLSGPAPGDTYVVNPRTPSAGAPSNAVRRNYRGGRVGRFQARQGREDEELLNFSDFDGIPSNQFDGMSSNHHYNLNNMNNLNNLNNQYYQSFQNHRVKRHEEEMKKTNLGEVNTNSSLQVLSPDDVAFSLPKSQNFKDSEVPVSQYHETHAEWAPDHTVCVTLTNTSGILFLTFMSVIVASLISSSVITARRCWLKRQKFDKKLAPQSFTPHGKNPANSSTVATSKQTKKTIPQTAIPPKKLLEQQQQQKQKCSGSKK